MAGTLEGMEVDESTRLMIKNRDFFINQGSQFVPGKRLRMIYSSFIFRQSQFLMVGSFVSKTLFSFVQGINFVPIVLNVILPWILFAFLLTISIFRWRHENEYLTSMLWYMVVVPICIAFLYRFCQELHIVEATWVRAGCFHVIFVVYPIHKA